MTVWYQNGTEQTAKKLIWHRSYSISIYTLKELWHVNFGIILYITWNAPLPLQEFPIEEATSSMDLLGVARAASCKFVSDSILYRSSSALYLPPEMH